MGARTIQTPAALRRDTRFQACSPGAKWVFGHLCDRAEVAAERGLDVLGTVALIVEGLGDVPREVLAPLLEELGARGLVTTAADRLVIHALETAADRRGPHGGKSGAARTAEYRARKLEREAARVTAVTSQNPSRVTSPVTGDAAAVTPASVTSPVTVTDSPSHDPSQPARSDGCDGPVRHVTDDVTGSVDPGLSPEVPSPHTPLSPTPTPPNNNRAHEGSPAPAVDPEVAAKLRRLDELEADAAKRRQAEAEKAARAEKRTARKAAATRPDAIPLAGTLAHDVYRAIVDDPAIGPLVDHPGDFASRITHPKAHPGVDVLATVLAGAEYVARHPGDYTDGRAFLMNQLRKRPVRSDPRQSGAYPLRPRPVSTHAPAGDAEIADLTDTYARAQAEYRAAPGGTR